MCVWVPKSAQMRTARTHIAEIGHLRKHSGGNVRSRPVILGMKKPRRSGAEGARRTRGRYWMRVRQYGHTFQSALSGRWQVGQTLRTCVLQIGQTTKSRSMGAPHLGQMP